MPTDMTTGSAPRLHGDPPLYLTSPLLTEAGLPHLFSTRHCPGIRPWRDAAGPFDPDSAAIFGERGLTGPIAYLRQVHGADVAVAASGGLLGSADVLVTEKPGLPMAIFTADCLPVIVYDRANRRLSMAHAGWRGTVAAAARSAVDALIEMGGAAERFVAAIGPSIGACCYEVDAPVIEPLAAAFPDSWTRWAARAGAGKWMLDLWRANLDQLVAAGVGADRIDNPRLCTSCRADLFYSYRRGRGQGRLVAVAAIPDGPDGAC
jgi:YfiH family protein